jgi:hypothetical protein
MPVKLTLDIFSGRSNPFIILDDPSARRLLKQLSFGALRKQNEKTNPFPSVLGYRGLIIEQTGKPISKELPAILHYAHDTVYTGDKAARAEAGLESFLFDHFRSLKNSKGISGFRELTEKMLVEFLDKRNIYVENYRKWFDTIIDDYVPIWEPGTRIILLPETITVITTALITGRILLHNPARQRDRCILICLPAMCLPVRSVPRWVPCRMD